MADARFHPYIAIVDAAAVDPPRGRRLLVSAKASSKAFIWSVRRGRPLRRACGRFAVCLGLFCRLAARGGRVDGCAARLRGAISCPAGWGSLSCAARRLAPARGLLCSAAPADGLPARGGRNPWSAAVGVRWLPAARTGTTANAFQWQCLGQTGAEARQWSATAAERGEWATSDAGQPRTPTVLASVLQAAS